MLFCIGYLESCCSPLDSFNHQLVTNVQKDAILPEISPTRGPQPFLPFLAPSPLAPFTNLTAPKLSGIHPWKHSSFIYILKGSLGL